jgi:hypothetical protein
MHSVVPIARAALLSCALLATAAHAQFRPLTAVQTLEPKEAEVTPTPDEFVPVGFGTDVAIEGTRALISLPEADGSAGRIAVFKRQPTGQWQRIGRLRFPSRPNGVKFVELRGGIAVVASRDTVHVFRPTPHGGWQHARAFEMEGEEEIQDLKYDGYTAVVGTRFGQSGDAVYVLHINHALIARRHKLPVPSGAPSDEFGTSVAVFGDTLVVGAPGFNDGQGAVHVYQHRGTRWRHVQMLVAADGEPDDRFGASVALANHSMVIGAPNADPEYGGEFEELQRSGTAFVFAPHRGRWAQSQKVRPSDDGVDDFTSFGTHVESDGRRVVIGAPGFRGLTFDDGALFIYSRYGRQLQAERHALESNELGYAFALSGNTVIAGVVEPTFSSGRALVFDLGTR